VDPIDKLIFILSALPTTLAISVLSFLAGFVIGLPLAFIRAYTGKPFQILVGGYEKVFRGVPEIVLMLFLYYGLGGLPAFEMFKNPFFAATFALGLRSGAHQSQIFRGAIRSVGDEQMLAARSLGLSRLQAIVYVMIPQTFIVASPGLGSEYALLVKDSSYAFVLGVVEMMRKTYTVMRITLDPVFPFVAAALLYILVTFPLATYLDTWGSRKKRQLGL
jgi:polar amino acid transport system permease protein